MISNIRHFIGKESKVKEEILQIEMLLDDLSHIDCSCESELYTILSKSIVYWRGELEKLVREKRALNDLIKIHLRTK